MFKGTLSSSCSVQDVFFRIKEENSNFFHFFIFLPKFLFTGLSDGTANGNSTFSKAIIYPQPLWVLSNLRYCTSQ